MVKEKIIKDAEELMLTNIPKSRLDSNNSNAGYLRHIYGAKKFGLQLAEHYKADKFVVEVACLLHDIEADRGSEHAFYGSEKAKIFLDKYDIPNETKTKIIECIKNHSLDSITQTIEEQILQDADGLIFIEDSYKLFEEIASKKYSQEEVKEIIEGRIKAARIRKIKTEKGKEILNSLWKE